MTEGLNFDYTLLLPEFILGGLVVLVVGLDLFLPGMRKTVSSREPRWRLSARDPVLNALRKMNPQSRFWSRSKRRSPPPSFAFSPSSSSSSTASGCAKSVPPTKSSSSAS